MPRCIAEKIDAQLCAASIALGIIVIPTHERIRVTAKASPFNQRWGRVHNFYICFKVVF